jgi:hypothetical protein
MIGRLFTARVPAALRVHEGDLALTPGRPRVSARAREGRPDSARTRTARRLVSPGLSAVTRACALVCRALPGGLGTSWKAVYAGEREPPSPFRHHMRAPSWSRSSSARKCGGAVASDIGGAGQSWGLVHAPRRPWRAGYRDHPALPRWSRATRSGSTAGRPASEARRYPRIGGPGRDVRETSPGCTWPCGILGRRTRRKKDRTGPAGMIAHA